MATESFGRIWELSPEASERLLDYLNDDNIPGFYMPDEEVDAIMDELKRGEELLKRFECDCKPS